MMPYAMLDLFVQFVFELLRTLLVDELSGRVHRGLTRCFSERGQAGFHSTRTRLHRHASKRLLHRLRTELEDEP